MGRRKIEIQPITHERNRSVTFLKRKNGLFKKAYELGVLCSVDVAVIIFEERPGHHVKLYQYCSTDVHSMVQRHLRFEGEKDTRGPADFNNNKVEEAVDDDEDIDDDDGNGQGKRRDSLKSGKVKIEGNGTGSIPIRSLGQQNDSVELDYRSEPRLSPILPSSSSSIPISGERHNTSPGMRGSVAISNKRPRLAPNIGSPDVLGPHSAPAGFGSQSYPFRLDVDVNQFANHVPPVSHAHSHPSLSALYNGPNSVSGVHGPNSQPTFFPQAPFDPPRPPNPPTLRSVAFPSQPSTSYAQQQSQGGFPHHGRTPASQHGSSTNWFVELLNAPSEPASAHHPPSDGHLSSFAWPVHVQQSQAPQHENVPPPQPSPDNNWFDFLPPSASSAPAPALGLPLGAPPHSRPASNSISSTRSAASFAVPGRLSPAHKRAREDDGTGASGSDYNDEDEHSVFNGLMEEARSRSGDGTDG